MTYNPDDQRIEKQDSAGTAKFIWDDQKYLLETNVSDTTQVVYTNEPQQYGNLISQRRASTTSFYHFDALGSTREMTNASETTTDNWVYEAYGDEVARTGTTVNPFRYVGRLSYYFDVDTATYYVRARVYDPGIARWLSQDPLFYAWAGTLANPYSFTRRRFESELGRWRFISRDPIGYERGINLYEYVRSAPLQNTDPSGLQTRYGFFCGARRGPVAPGTTPIDDLDTCCEAHDDCYEDCGLSGLEGVYCPSRCGRIVCGVKV